jgi:GMP synthase-like glutamine amidotransferase
LLGLRYSPYDCGNLIRQNVMKPIAIAQHHHEDGPSHFATFLARAGLPYRIFLLDRGDAPPVNIHDFAGFCLLGGPMSANDDLPYLGPVMNLVLDAMAADIPVIGHCLGGQLMAKALGANVGRAENAEIGWSNLEIRDSGTKWFGGRKQVRVFQWHSESFAIPDEAQWIASSPYCANQAFQIGKHLAMQFHCEVSVDKVKVWLANDHQDLLSHARSPGVQDPQVLLDTLEEDIAVSQSVADDIYGEWIKGLKG